MIIYRFFILEKDVSSYITNYHLLRINLYLVLMQPFMVEYFLLRIFLIGEIFEG